MQIGMLPAYATACAGNAPTSSADGARWPGRRDRAGHPRGRGADQSAGHDAADRLGAAGGAEVASSRKQAATVVLLSRRGGNLRRAIPARWGGCLEKPGQSTSPPYVVGFDMTDAGTAHLVACLADETGGLSSPPTIRRTSPARCARRSSRPPVVTPDPGPGLRQVSITLRDTAAGEPITRAHRSSGHRAAGADGTAHRRPARTQDSRDGHGPGSCPASHRRTSGARPRAARRCPCSRDLRCPRAPAPMANRPRRSVPGASDPRCPMPGCHAAKRRQPALAAYGSTRAGAISWCNPRRTRHDKPRRLWRH